MRHEPPVPPDNQSPFPIAEPPHDHPVPLPPVVASEAKSRLPLIAGAIAAVGLAAGGAFAFVLSRARPKPQRRPSLRKK